MLAEHDTTVAVVDDPRFDAHRPRGNHPERPERLAAARSGLDRTLPGARRLPIDPPAVEVDDLERVHDPAYLRRLHDALSAGWGHLGADTYFSPETEEAYRIAAGGAVELSRSLQDGRARSGIALLRPPGHHATRSAAMGFCIANNVAVAAASALARGAARVAVLDWDVHHGNGTQTIFEDDSRVLFVSLHQWPLYPGTGAPEEIGRGQGAGRTVNVALPAGSSPEVYGAAMRRVALPLLDAFGADLTFVSAGFDAHRRDPLAGMELDRDTFGAMATAVLGEGRGPVGLFLEGGYDLQALEESVAAVGSALAGGRTELPEGPLPERADRAIERTLRAIRPAWPDVPLR